MPPTRRSVKRVERQSSHSITICSNEIFFHDFLFNCINSFLFLVLTQPILLSSLFPLKSCAVSFLSLSLRLRSLASSHLQFGVPSCVVPFHAFAAIVQTFTTITSHSHVLWYTFARSAAPARASYSAAHATVAVSYTHLTLPTT